LRSFDGKAWTTHEIRLKGAPESVKPLLGPGELFVAGKRLLVLSPFVLYTFDGRSWESSTPGAAAASADGEEFFLLKDDGHVAVSRDAKSWKVITKDPVPADALKRTELTYRRASMAAWRGRLVVGGGDGRILASRYVARGVHITAPAEGGGRVHVDASIPDGTELTLEVRSASTKTDLERAAWSTDAVVEEGRWWQARLTLVSDREGRRTPLVRRVSAR
jgi:hypothetical protein